MKECFTTVTDAVRTSAQGRIHGLKKNWGTNHGEREERGADRCEMWEGVFPSHQGQPIF